MKEGKREKLHFFYDMKKISRRFHFLLRGKKSAQNVSIILAGIMIMPDYNIALL